MSTTDTVPRPTRFTGAEKSCKGGRRDGMDYEMQKNKKQTNKKRQNQSSFVFH